ncbi:reverse transcriptase [Puccinia sorghi]|uniref:Reverse transcriptase n=1 Tax=Puccinia sorghi TaxID=27349 RepID=A0A0L6V163_9BASI|nr:reverse transcriptase [Puccinia sorghi]
MARLLALNAKFCLKPRYEKPNQVLSLWKDFACSVRIRVIFSEESDDEDFVPKFHIKSDKPFDSLPGFPDVEEGLRVGGRLLSSALSKVSRNDWIPSLSSTKTRTFDELIHNDAYLFKPCDKNLGMSILPTTWYIDELNMAELTSELCSLLASPIFTKQARKFILHSLRKPSIPEFYILPKVHKNPIKGRPIVPSFNWITTNLSKWLDYTLRPFLQEFPWILRDSKQLLQQLPALSLSKDDSIWLLTADVTSFYSSLPNETGCKIIRWLATKNDYSDTDADTLSEALGFVLNNNFLSFGSAVYRQVFGTAMGTACAPVYANLFAAAYESLTMDNKPTSLVYYGRFLDDILVIVKGSNTDVEIVKRFVDDSLGDLELSWTVSQTSLAFLDINLQVNATDCSAPRITTSVYQKPSNAYQYIPWSSYHPPKVKLAFVKGELVRYARTSSTKEAYLNVSSLFYQRLRSRGYPIGWLRFAFRTVKWKDRQQLLTDRVKTALSPKPPLVFHAAYNPIWNKIRMKRSFDALLGVCSNQSRFRFLGKQPRPIMCFHRANYLASAGDTNDRCHAARSTFTGSIDGDGLCPLLRRSRPPNTAASSANDRVGCRRKRSVAAYNRRRVLSLTRGARYTCLTCLQTRTISTGYPGGLLAALLENRSRCSTIDKPVPKHTSPHFFCRYYYIDQINDLEAYSIQMELSSILIQYCTNSNSIRKKIITLRFSLLSLTTILTLYLSSESLSIHSASHRVRLRYLVPIILPSPLDRCLIFLLHYLSVAIDRNKPPCQPDPVFHSTPPAIPSTSFTDKRVRAQILRLRSDRRLSAALNFKVALPSLILLTPLCFFGQTNSIRSITKTFAYTTTFVRVLSVFFSEARRRSEPYYRCRVSPETSYSC